MNINEECLKLLTPKASGQPADFNITHLFYKGMSFLRYAMEIDLDVHLLENLMDLEYCSRELITVKDPVNF
jgi:hypothetical protein